MADRGRPLVVDGRVLRLIRRLAPAPFADRWLALDEAAQTNHVLYDLTAAAEANGRLAVLDRLSRLARCGGPHVLVIDDCWQDGDQIWACTPYTGNEHGLVTLDGLVAAKGGTLPGPETERAVEQVLVGLEALHAAGLTDATVTWERLLVDRSGSVSVEMHGLIEPRCEPFEESVRNEIGWVAGLAYKLLTGLDPDEPRVPLQRLSPRTGERFVQWVERGLDPVGGFVTAEAALAALPSRSEAGPGGLRGTLGPRSAGLVLGRLGRAIGLRPTM